MTGKLKKQLLKIIRDLASQESGLDPNYSTAEDLLDKLIEDEYNRGYEAGEDLGYSKGRDKAFSEERFR